MREEGGTRDLSIASHQHTEERDYWLRKMSGELEKSGFPRDYDHKTNAGAALSPGDFMGIKIGFSPAWMPRLMAISKGYDYTLHMLLTAAVKVLLARYTGQWDIIVGAPIYKQASVEDEELVNRVLALRTGLDPALTVKELLLQVRQTIIEADKYQNYPIETLLYQLGVPFSGDRDDFPLFDVVVLLENIHDRRYIQHIPFHVLFSFVKTGTHVEGVLEYDSSRYSKETATRIMNHFVHILGQFLDNIDLKLADIKLLSEAEKKQLLWEFNHTDTPYPRDKMPDELFMEQVRRAPHRLAVVYRDKEITFKELAKRADRLAEILREKGVGSNRIIGIMEERSLEMVIDILGILKAGGGYLPIDPGMPFNRTLYMLADANVPIVLTTSRTIAGDSFTRLQGLQAARGQPKITAPRAPIRDLDGLPVPDRSLIDYETYAQHISLAMVKNCITLQGTRGCPYDCAYCAKLWPKKHVARSAENMFKEVKLYYDMGVRRFAFIDDIFNINIKNSSRFFQLILKEGMKVHFLFPAGLRGDIMTRDYIDLMVEAGTINISVALETASPRLQKLIRKKLDIGRLRENLEYICKRHPRVILDLFTMHGLPTETEAEAIKTLDFIKSLKWLHFPLINILKIYPGTDMETLALESGISRESILKAENLAWHEFSDTLPFDRNFTSGYQADFLNNYFLLKERLLHVLPHQMKLLTEDEIVQKYNSYLPFEINGFDGLLEFMDISREELGKVTCLEEKQAAVPRLNEKIKAHFPVKPEEKGALKVLLLDLSQSFSGEAQLLDELFEPPLGLMYLMTYLNHRFGAGVKGKIAKSRVDFDDYVTLKGMIAEFAPDVIGIRTLTFYKDFFHGTAAKVRQWGFTGPLLAGGPYATNGYRVMLQDGNIDLVVLSEGEITFSEVIEKIMANKGKLPDDEVLGNIPGIVFMPRETKKGLGSGREIIMVDCLEERLSKPLERNSSSNGNPGDPAYVIYTSGSTGRSRGVIISRGNVMNLLAGLHDRVYKRYQSQGSLRVALVAPYIFDASVKQVFGALMQGHTLHLVPEEERFDGGALVDFYNKYAIDISDGTPTHLQLLLESGNKDISRVLTKHFIIGGEPLVKNTVKRFWQGFAGKVPGITNVYGPTECSVDAVCFEVTRGNLEQYHNIPIGAPMSNHQVYILNNENKLQPVGVPGELCIGGEGLGRGYLNNPELTNKKFLRGGLNQWVSGSVGQLDDRQARLGNPLIMMPRPHPETNENQHQRFAQHIGSPRRGAPGRRRQTIYKTGDWARWMLDGNIEFLGRIDHQLKIRGFRIELGEIENRLVTHPGVKEAVVIVKVDKPRESDGYLCAFVVPVDNKKNIDRTKLKEYLSRELPIYMIPSYFVAIDRVPLTPNGKVDRRGLHQVELEPMEIYTAPRDEVDKRLVKIWREVLGLGEESQPLGIDDNFFERGGHSLKATILISRMHRAFDVRVPLQEIFQNPRIRLVSDYIKQNTGIHIHTSINPVEKKDYYELSSAQMRLYFLQQLDLKSTGYNLLLFSRLEGEVDSERLEDIFKRLTRRHESLRTAFVVVENKPRQRIYRYDEVGFHPEYAEVREEEAVQWRKEFITAFDLGKAPLLRVGLIKTGERQYILMVNMHHINADGVSQSILIKEFMALYGGEKLEPLRIQFKDFSGWQNSQLEREYMKKQGHYWKKRFEGEPPILELPTDFERPAVKSFAGKRLVFKIGSDEVRQLKEMAAREEVTLYMLLLAIYTVFLYKLTGQEDIVIGTPQAGRRHADLEPLIGMFVNTLAMRNFPNKEKTFKQFLEEVKENTSQVFQNQDYTFEELVKNIVKKVDRSRNPVFDTVFAMQNMDFPTVEIPGLKLLPYDYTDNVSKFDLGFFAMESDRELVMMVEYCTKLFKPETIERYTWNFSKVLALILEDEHICLKDIPVMLSDRERKQLLYDFNDTAADYPRDKRIEGLFEEQVEKTPDNIAVVGPPQEKHRTYRTYMTYLSYGELNERTNGLAQLLIEKGIQLDTIAGIMVGRSVEMIIGILGILKAGGAYMPIDPDYPGERIDFMLKDSSARILLTHKDIASSPSTLTSTCQVSPTNLAYIIYTSGTTGRPKGVMIEHENVVRLLFNDRFQFDFNDRDVWTMFHSPCFDFSVWEMYGALLYGGKLVIIPGLTARDPKLYLEVLKNQGVTILNQTPSAFYNLIVEELTQKKRELILKYVIFGGEALQPGRLREWRRRYPHTRLVNMFGITETTVHVTFKEIDDEDIRRGISNIGKPIPTLSAFVLAEDLRLLPLGVPGELYVGGAGVARGYLNQPELTAERFCLRRPGGALFEKTAPPGPPGKNFLLEGARGLAPLLYRTGDRARILPNGEMEYLGRIDRQVQLRGFRIELKEIEHRLLSYAGIQDAVVSARQDQHGETYLCAYMVSKNNQPISMAELRKYLSDLLPGYMIPLYFETLDRVPLTSNGKVDWKALPDPKAQTGGAVAPRNPVEARVAELWQRSLELEKPGVTDNYFNIGGDSIKAIHLVNLINTELKIELTIPDLYANDTVEKLAEIISQKQTKNRKEELEAATRQIEALKARIKSEHQLPDDIEDFYPMSDIEKGMIFLSGLDPEAAVYHDQTVYQVTLKDFDAGIFKKAVIRLVEKHEILRTVFNTRDYPEPIQLVFKQVPIDAAHHDISSLAKAAQEEYVNHFMREDRGDPFDLSRPLWRIRTFDLGAAKILVLVVCHHAILDGWSVASLSTELNNIYTRLTTDPSYAPGKLKSSYKDYIVDQVVQSKRKETIAFWQGQLEGYKRLDIFSMETVEERGAGQGRHLVRPEPGLEDQLTETARKYDTSIKHLCFAAFAYTLFMLSYDNDMVIGMVANNRPLCEDGDKILGCFINSVPVRMHIPDHMTWEGYIRQIEKKMKQLKPYERLSLYEIARLHGEVSTHGNPIFDILFNFVDFHIYGQALARGPDSDEADGSQAGPGQDLEVNNYATTNLSLVLSVGMTAGILSFLFYYDRSRISEQSVVRYCRYFQRVLNKMLQEPGSRMQKDEIIPGEEKKRLLKDFNAAGKAYPAEKSLHWLFEEQAERTPDHIAVVGPPRKKYRTYKTYMTYRELNRKSDQLAYSLRERGTGPDTIVGLLAERSIEMVMGILGILKAGGAYLPIEPQYPEERIKYMLKDSNASILLTHKDIVSSPSTLTSTCRVSPANLAYIIYTSGSTGQPKGVLVDHSQVVNTLVSRKEEYNMTSGDTALQLFSYAFDGFLTGFFTPVISGARVVQLSSEAAADINAVKNAIIKQRVTHFISVPAFYRAILEAMDRQVLGSIKVITLAGDMVSPQLLELTKEKSSRMELSHEYGVTEAAVMSTINRHQEKNNRVSIGRPVRNTRIYILDSSRCIQPLGVPGELCIAGTGVARGYLNNPELTARKFQILDEPGYNRSYRSYKSYIIYRTGDLARWLPQGNIEFLGRIDQQVKLRGFRIELGEIETRLCGHPGIKEAAVIVRETESKDKYLCAYIVLKGSESEQTFDAAGLKDYLSASLPIFMIPTYFAVVESIPLSPSGKVDKKALLSLEIKAGAGEEYIAPGNEIEEKLLEVWSEVLEIGKDIVGVNDNFFDLGGHSLKVMRLNNKIEGVFKRKIPVVKVFNYPTIRSFANYIKQENSQVNLSGEDRSAAIDKGKSRLKRLKRRIKEY